MSRRKPLPHEDVVSEMRRLVAHGNSLASIRISDDSDMWAVGRGEESPINRLASSACEAFDEARALGARLLELGEPAAAAVAKGLRTTGRWRDELLPFAERHRDHPAIREALELIAKRMHDSLCPKACALLGVPCKSPLANGGWRERRRRMRRWTR